MSNSIENNTHSRHQHGNAAPAKKGGFQRWVANAVEHWQRSRVIAELEVLDDRTLADIGITRGEIPFVAAVVTQRASGGQAPVWSSDLSTARGEQARPIQRHTAEALSA